MKSDSPRPSSFLSPVHLRARAIEQRARAIWEEEGRPDGRSLDHWLRAEREADAGKKASPQSALAGNPAYPSLEERNKIVEANRGSPEVVPKLPASKLVVGDSRPSSASHSAG